MSCLTTKLCPSINVSLVLYPLILICSVFLNFENHHNEFKLPPSFVSYDGILGKLAMFIPQISTLLPNVTGYNRQLNGAKLTFNWMEQIFREPLPSSYVPNEPTSFKEAFIDHMKIHQENSASSFHESRKSLI